MKVEIEYTIGEDPEEYTIVGVKEECEEYLAKKQMLLLLSTKVVNE